MADVCVPCLAGRSLQHEFHLGLVCVEGFRDFSMVRAIQAAVHAIVREVERRKENDAIAVVGLLLMS